ncbi:MAG: transporter substrate-binding protein [Rhodoglobus sp.]|nr:transporter substrate-binding protein [Rhodoglobus sp.]
MSSPQRLTRIGGAVITAALIAGLAACAADPSAEPASSDTNSTVTIGAFSNGVATETSVEVPVVEDIRSTLPKEVLDSGKLVIGIGDLPSGFPPLAYVGDDDETETGSESDLGRLVAAVFGLQPEFKPSTWDNLFVGIDTGATNVGLSNITDTEKRKEKYDFASYRGDNLGFEVLKSNDWEFDGDYENLDGLTVAVGAGTNQEKLLLAWQEKLQAEGKSLEISYFADSNSTYLALNSGQIDAYFTPNPGIAYHVSQTADSADPTRNAGTFSGAGETLDGLIAATVKKDSGLAEPFAAAINYLIENGQYDTWLATWGLENEAVEKSLVNPPGLPLDNQ